MKNKLYLECTSGISGDMTVAALLDLGADQKKLERALKSLPVKGFDIKISRVVKSGIDACDFDVLLDQEHENYDHDMEYLHGHSHSHAHEEHHHQHSHEALEAHEHTHSHEHHVHTETVHSHHGHHHHEHRGLNEIMEIIDHADMTDRARSYAKKIFTILAHAEAKAHNVPEDMVHFHEVGAVDSIVDILSVAICMDDLDVEEVIVPRLCEGSGTIRCQHGVIPVPVPAVLNIAQQHGLTLHITETEAELVTPTGAAIVAAVRTSDHLPGKYKIRRIGMGAGKRDYGRTSILRGMLIEPESEEADYIYKLETNLDDCTPEALGHVMERLFKAGARDVHYIPVFMKKNRPAYQMNVICSEEDVPKMEEIIFHETTTIGIRRVKMERTVMQREICTVRTSLGEAKVKVCRLEGYVRVYPEYESVTAICREKGLSYQEVWSRVRHEAEDEVLS